MLLLLHRQEGRACGLLRYPIRRLKKEATVARVQTTDVQGPPGALLLTEKRVAGRGIYLLWITSHQTRFYDQYLPHGAGPVGACTDWWATYINRGSSSKGVLAWTTCATASH